MTTTTAATTIRMAPTGDLGVRKGMQRHFRLRALPEPVRTEKLARPWAPFRSIASWYMWRSLE